MPLETVIPKMPPEAFDLLERMLKMNPSERISVADALTHDYLSDV